MSPDMQCRAVGGTAGTAGSSQVVQQIPRERTDFGAALGQTEVVLEPDGEAGVVADPADALEDAGHERVAVEGVVPDRQLLPRVAEQDLLVRDQAPEPHRVDRDPVDPAAAGPELVG